MGHPFNISQDSAAWVIDSLRYTNYTVFRLSWQDQLYEGDFEIE